nr:hypothetical protein [uncultured Psychrobacter sp.]
MKDKTLFLSSVVVAFVFGVFSTYLFMTKQQMDYVMQAKQQSAVSSDTNNNQDAFNSANGLASDDSLNGRDSAAQQAISNVTGSDSTSINDYSQEQAQAMVDTMPDYVLGQYVDKFMAKGDSEVITDKRRFAERAIEELYDKGDTRPLVGEVKLSYDSSMPQASIDTSMLNKNAKLFAHLDTAGKVPASPFAFVKWVNNETGQVLLFEKKNIIADSNQNWVSFKPYDGWEPGSYDVKFYQFTSELEPIARLTYQIYTVNDETKGERGVVTSSTVSIANATVRK